MNKFKVGDKVLITKGTDKGNYGIILNVSENGYFMKNDNFNSYGMSKYFYAKKDENALQLLERKETSNEQV